MNTAEDVDVLIERMAQGLRRQIESRDLAGAVMVGIRTGGVWVAEKLHPMLGIEAPLGALNINFYRDDFTRIGMHPQVTPSNLPFSVDGRHILLVDDVLFTGRTIRAALNEIFDYGRPASVTLAVLVERNGREIPVQADVVGQSLTLSEHEYVKLRGPDPLRLEMISRDR